MRSLTLHNSLMWEAWALLFEHLGDQAAGDGDEDDLAAFDDAWQDCNRATALRYYSPERLLQVLGL